MIDRSQTDTAPTWRTSPLRATGRVVVHSGTALTVIGGSLAWAASPVAAVEYDPDDFANVHTVTTTANDGDGSLRAALAAAVDGDLIVFDLDPGSTIELAGTPLAVDEAVTIDAPDGAGITVDGNGLSGVFYIYPYLGDQVIIDSLTVTGGAAGGGGIDSGRADLVLQEVTLSGNNVTGDGGGIRVRSGDLTLTGSTVSGNTAAENGGGLYVVTNGAYDVTSVTITDSQITGNTAGSDPYYGIGGGAAIQQVYGDVTITGTTVSGNHAGFGGGLAISEVTGQVTVDDSTINNNYAHKYGGGPSGIGGGIAVDGSAGVTISDSTISGNIADFSGGGVFVKYSYGERPRALEEDFQSALEVTDDPVLIVDTVLSGNGAFIGGGISATEAEVRLVNSQVSGNIATEDFGTFFGGGVALKYSDLDLVDSRITANTAFMGGGVFAKYGSAVASDNSVIAQNDAKYGGGISVDFPSGRSRSSSFAHLYETTVAGNTAYGGGGVVVGSYGDLAVVQSTISGNRAEVVAEDGAGEGSGGGVMLTKYADMEMVNSTVSGNFATGAGGGIWVHTQGVDADIKYSTIADNTAEYGGGIAVNEDNIDTVTLDHTIVGDNSAYDVVGPVDAYTSLIENPEDELSISGAGNIFGQDPELFALDDNGGPTETHLPMEDSPVLDAGAENPDVEIDQRGENRPDGDAADIGAVEAFGSGTVVRVTATTPEAVEGGANGVFTFTRTGDTSSSLTVGYSVAGTATSGIDYEALGTAVIPAGQSSVTIDVVALVDDIDEEPDETVEVTILDGSGYTVATPITDTVTILDEAPAVEPDEPPCTDAGEDGFTDVQEGDGTQQGNVHEAAIDCLAALGITEGGPGDLPDDQYGPALSVTRGQMASFIARLITAAGVALPENPDDEFDDDNGTEHEANINALFAAGIVEGFEDGTYREGDPVRRDQMASFLLRTYEYITGSTLSPGDDAFDDDEGTVEEPNVHEAAINALAAAGVIEGKESPPRTYDPSSDVRRDQMASFLIRLAELLAAEGNFPVDEEPPPAEA